MNKMLLTVVFIILAGVVIGANAAEAGSCSCDQKSEAMLKTGAVYYSEIIIEKPVEEVWSELIDIRKWNPSLVNVEHVHLKGEPQQVGEKFQVTKSYKGAKPFTFETIRMRPLQNIVWKVYSEEGGFSNFGDFGLQDMGDGKTRLNISYYAQGLSDVAIEEVREGQAQGKRVGNELGVGLVELSQFFKEYMEKSN